MDTRKKWSGAHNNVNFNGGLSPTDAVGADQNPNIVSIENFQDFEANEHQTNFPDHNLEKGYITEETRPL